MDEKVKELERRIFKLEMDVYVYNDLLTKLRFEIHKLKMYVLGFNFLIALYIIYLIYQIINYIWGK